MLNKLSLDNQI